jgi:pimeloyl-ACP methyl ester carboxylesterase
MAVLLVCMDLCGENRKSRLAALLLAEVHIIGAMTPRQEQGSPRNLQDHPWVSVNGLAATGSTPCGRIFLRPHVDDIIEKDRPQRIVYWGGSTMRSVLRVNRLWALALGALLLGSPAQTTADGSAEKPKDGWFTTSDGIKIHYLEMGQGTPVILVHGFRSSAERNYFANGLAQTLAKNHRVVAIDCRNHGLSDKPRPNTPGTPKDVVELIDHLGIKKAHFQGYSMGGNIVSHLLVMIPDRIISLSMRGMGIPEVDPQWRAKIPEDKPVPERAKGKGFGLMASAAPPGLDLAKIDIPILVIVGEFDMPNQRTSRLSREAKNFKKVVLAGKDHFSAISAYYDPAEYITNLAEFINANDPQE